MPREKEHPEQSSPLSLGGTCWCERKYCLSPAEASFTVLFLARFFGLISFCSSPTLTVVVPHFCGVCVPVGSSETAEQGFSSLLSSAESACRRMSSNTSPVRCCQCRAVPYRHFHISGEITNTQDPNPGRTPHSVSGPGSWGSLGLCVVSKNTNFGPSATLCTCSQAG